MNRIYRLFEASPEAAFAELDDNLTQLSARLAAVSEVADALHHSFEMALKTLTATAVTVPAPTRWTYDARLPNRYFDGVFAPEITPDVAKRWVRRAGSLKTRLALPRNVQYDFSIGVADFVVPECQATLRLAVDGNTYPWLSVEGNVFSTIIPEDLQAQDLEFEVSVDPELVPHDKDVSFSFSCIDIVRRGIAANGPQDDPQER